MTYPSKRKRVVANAGTTPLTDDAQPSTKRYTIPSNHVAPKASFQYGPFVPPSSNSIKSTHATPIVNKIEGIWKKQPTGTISSALPPQTKEFPKVTSIIPPKLSPTISPNIPLPTTLDSLTHPSTSSFSSRPPAKHSIDTLPQCSKEIVKNSVKSGLEGIGGTPNQTEKKSAEEREDKSKAPKSLRVKSLPDWPSNVEFDDKEEVMTIDAKDNIVLVSGSIQPIDVWSNNGVRYFVEFNDLYQPLRKGGHILVRFIGSIAKVEDFCPVGEVDWHKVDKYLKARIIKEIRDRFVIPDGVEYDNQALKRTSKCWRQYKYDLKQAYYKPDEKTIGEMCSGVPHGISSNNWCKLVRYWDSEKGKKLSISGKEARASQNQFHRTGSNSFANQQADYEDVHGKKMSLLALWRKTHMGKDESFLPGTVTEEFLEDVHAKLETLRRVHPSKSQQELEDEAFEHTMYGSDTPDRPTGYGFGVRKGDIYGVKGVLRKERSGQIRKRPVQVVSEIRMEEVSKENGMLKAQLQETKFMFKTIMGQFAEVLGKVRSGDASKELLDATQSVLDAANPSVKNDKCATEKQG